ncbi:MAG: DEAD/DEAH box helicase, partial [Aeromonas veronii]
MSTASFAELALSPRLQQTLSELGYAAPTPIQARAIPTILAGRDLMAGAQTGTGKTAAFVLPLLEQLLQQPQAEPRPIRALILVPTRELAVQVAESVARYGQGTGLTSTLVYGGVSIAAQVDALKNGVDLLIATPGRLLDHLRQGALSL